MKFDEIGYWSEVKLDILKDYATEYTKILGKQTALNKYLYIDAFAGSGIHKSRTTGEFIKGSPTSALLVNPPFHEYHFIDLDSTKVESLVKIADEREDVFIYQGNCNEILLEKVFPRALFRDRNRALCLLDPYGLQLNWKIIHKAGQEKSIEIFLNFPIMDMNRNVFWDNPEKVSPEDIGRMNSFWGDNSWEEAAYNKNINLFGEDVLTPRGKHHVAEAFQKRLKEVAGFKHVPDPIPMRNSNGSKVYYLFFASGNKVGSKIVNHIFRKYENRGIS